MLGLIQLCGLRRTSRIASEAFSLIFHILQIMSHKAILLHNKAWPHSAQRTQEELEKFKWVVFPYPPYSQEMQVGSFSTSSIFSRNSNGDFSHSLHILTKSSCRMIMLGLTQLERLRRNLRNSSGKFSHSLHIIQILLPVNYISFPHSNCILGVSPFTQMMK